MSTPMRDVATVVELGQRVMWKLMTPAEYRQENERALRWSALGLPMPSKWEKGQVPLQTVNTSSPVFNLVVKTVTTETL